MSSSQKLKATIILCFFLSPTAKSSQSYGQNTRADDHAPNMIMGDHTHEAGGHNFAEGDFGLYWD